MGVVDMTALENGSMHSSPIMSGYELQSLLERLSRGSVARDTAEGLRSSQTPVRW